MSTINATHVSTDWLGCLKMWKEHQKPVWWLILTDLYQSLCLFLHCSLKVLLIFGFYNMKISKSMKFLDTGLNYSQMKNTVKPWYSGFICLPKSVHSLEESTISNQALIYLLFLCPLNQGNPLYQGFNLQVKDVLLIVKQFAVWVSIYRDSCTLWVIREIFVSFEKMSGRKKIVFNAGNLTYGKCIHKSALQKCF